jgi:D-alanyl-D-alanine dipeptidase
MGSDFDEFSDRSRLDWYEPAVSAGSAPAGGSIQTSVAGRLRRLLACCLVEVGLAPLETEWWHWSFGDQRWAAFKRRVSSMYASVEGL